MLEKNCCSLNNDNKSKPSGFFQGLLFGLLPHSFCITFIVFTIIGSTLTASFFKKVLLIPNFFQLLLAFSFLMSLISAGIYLKKLKLFSLKGVVKKWKYLSILIGTTVGINLLFFNVIFPTVANVSSQKTNKIAQTVGTVSFTLKVNIPCSGHAPIIINDIKKILAVSSVRYISPDLFEINYDSSKTSTIEIMNLEIFKTFPATIIK